VCRKAPHLVAYVRVGELQPLFEANLAGSALIHRVEVLFPASNAGLRGSEKLRGQGRQAMRPGERPSLLDHLVELLEVHLPVAVLVRVLETLPEETVEFFVLGAGPALRQRHREVHEVGFGAVHRRVVAWLSQCHLASNVLEGVLEPVVEADGARLAGVHGLEKLRTSGSALLDGLVCLLVRGGQAKPSNVLSGQFHHHVKLLDVHLAVVVVISIQEDLQQELIELLVLGASCI